MSQIYRIFIRHETEAQPTWFKTRSEKSQDELTNELYSAMQQPAPSLWSCADLGGNIWIFRADKIYTVCVYPAETGESAEEGPHIHIS